MKIWKNNITFDTIKLLTDHCLLHKLPNFCIAKSYLHRSVINMDFLTLMSVAWNSDLVLIANQVVRFLYFNHGIVSSTTTCAFTRNNGSLKARR